MGHRISAIVLRGPFDAERAASFDMRPILISADLTVFPLDPNYCDCWSARLGITGNVTDPPLLNCRVIHEMVRAVTIDPLFAVIETDYFGGDGDQCAVVYRGEKEIVPAAKGPIGPINTALRALDVRAYRPLDEFDTVGLGRYRNWGDLFESYRDWDEPEQSRT